MAQAKLPDVNAGIVRYRSLAIEGFENNDPVLAEMALGNIVALLPAEFKIKINTDEYEAKVREQNFIVCTHCQHENPREEIKPWPLKLYGFSQVLARHDCIYLWNCKKCHRENELNRSKKVIDRLKNPAYLGIIPDPPKKRYGITDRASFPRQFRDWYKIASKEIESKIGIYRAEYISQQAREEQEDPNFGKDEV